MKKNKTMRLASVLLVLVLLSTCVISGTFAKYVTSASGSDSARVAKWGVQLSITGDNFATKYETHDDSSDTGYDGEFSVVATNDLEHFKGVVAPGTSSDDVDGNVLIKITGSPEVATRAKIVLTDVSDIKLPKGTYIDYTRVTGYDASGNPTYGTFELAKDYYPVVWTLKQKSTGSTGWSKMDTITGTLADIKTALEAYNTDISQSSYAANQSLNAEFELEWAWDFDEHGAGTNDKADTYLGNVIAGIKTDSSAITTVAYNLTATITQVD